MKTLKNLRKGTFVRATDEEADLKVKNSSEWAYAPKSEWKNRGKDTDVEETVEVGVETEVKSVKKRNPKKKN